MARHERPDTAPEKDECIRHCMRLMQVPGGWVTGKTAPELARRWGLNQKTVEGYSAEASRRLRDAQFDKETSKMLVVEHLRFISGLAMGKPNGKGRELRTAVAALAELADILGLKDLGDDDPAEMNLTIFAYPPTEEAPAKQDVDAGSEVEPSSE